jgi:hypothetical protein
MEKPLGLLSPETVIRPRVVPRLRLLLELEPRRRVFLNNLKDAILRREPAPVEISSPPGEFWHDVFVPADLPWKSFQESMLWHMVVMLAAWGVTQAWVHRPQPRVNQTAFRASGSLYYTPPKDFASSRSRPARSAISSHKRAATVAHGPKPMPVAPERRGAAPAMVVPPDLKMAIGNRAPNLATENTMPSVPLSATSPTKQTPLGGLGSVVAPPPELGGRGNRLTNGLPSAVVAPPADVAGMAGKRSMGGPGATVVAPPPDLQTARSMGKLGGGNTQVIAPPPSAQGLAAGSGRGTRSLGAVGAAIVPPPPSIEHSGRAGSVSGPGSAVVPPPPSVQGAGLGGGIRAAGAPGTAGSQVVPPPPSTQGSGGGVLAALSSFFSGSSSKIVPPPPGIQGTEGAGGRGGQMGSLGGGGSSVVPPPPGMQGGGNGRGAITSLGSGGNEIVPPPPSLQGAGGNAGRGGAGGSLAGGSRVVPPPPSLPGAGSGRGMGSGTGTHGGGSLSSGAAEVVPPPPSVGNGTDGMGSGGNGRLNSLGGGGQVVPPPPNLQGSGGHGNGNGNGNGSRTGSLVAGGGNVVGAPPPMAGEGNGGGGGTNGARGGGLSGAGLGASPPPVGAGSVSTGPLEQMDPLPDVPDSAHNTPAVPDNAIPPGEDVPLRLIAVPGAVSRTSFFSNYEVVLAERTVSATKTEIIKLVYISLPYQKRLFEYDWNSARPYKLRVRQNPNCDESLMEMMMPEGGGFLDSDAEASANVLATKVGGKNMKLHCYETTADDFQRAMSRH